jgi:hypothetical protein
VHGRGSVLSVMRLAAPLLLLFACEGPIGPRGATGPRGEDGTDAPPTMHDDAAAPAEDGGVGEHDASQPADFPLEPAGLVGEVVDTAGRLVGRGRVVLVPAADVRALGAAPLDLSLSPEAAAAALDDEPLEDVIDARGAELESAELDPRGRYRFTTLGDGDSFVVFVPASDDADHLPSMDGTRLPRSAQALRGGRLDLRVSCTPSADARYVGSTPCLTCHGRHESLASAHALTLRRPGHGSFLQDTRAAPRIDEALREFRAGRTLHFYDCAARSDGLPACAVSATAPADATRVALTARLVHDASMAPGALGEYRVELERADGAEQASYPVLVTLGGALSAQQFVTRIALPGGGFSHFVLPLTYQLAGSDDRSSYRDYRWLAYRVEDWLDLEARTLREPALPRSFDRECAGCHVTGVAVRGDASSGFLASAAPEPEGIADLDGDGRLEQLNVGCESCHGPGSEHIESTPRGQAIVSPGLLTPERQALVCGACHSKPLGKGGSLAPLDAQGHMPRPGERRLGYLRDHVSRVDASTDDLFASGDSRHAGQQYTDFIRSPKYRSGALLVTCSDCHAPHREAEQPSSLWRAPGDEGACMACHAEPADLHAHALAEVDFDHVRAVDQDALSCVSCHMVKTATAGARPLALVDQSPLPRVEYTRGDRTSHRFAFVGREAAGEQPVAATHECAFCHADFLSND